MTVSMRRYSLFYFCYYAALGSTTPFLGRWLDALGHGGYVIGAMWALWYASRVLGPPLWAALSARSARPGHWFVAGCALMALCFAGFTVARGAGALFAVMLLFGLFYNAVMPQFEAMTLHALGSQSAQYGRIRVWGSIGFMLISGAFGTLLDYLGNPSFPWITLPLLLAALLAAWPHRHTSLPAKVAAQDDDEHLWRRPGIRRFLLVALLMQIGFGAYYAYFTLYLQQQGFSGGTIGRLWALGVLVEIVLFWQAPRLIARFGAARLLAACLAATTARWLATAWFASSLPLLILAQASHALSFAIFHACSMRLMADFFPGHRQAAGQGLYYAFSSGVGGVVSAGIAALAWDIGGGQLAFTASALATASAWLIYSRRAATPATATATAKA